MHSVMFGIISGFYLLDASCTHTRTHTEIPITKNVPRHCQISFVGQKCPWLRTTAPQRKGKRESGVGEAAGHLCRGEEI